MGSHKDKRGSKHKHRSKEKKRGRDKERKHKKDRKRRRSSSGSDSSDSSGSDGGRIDVNQQLAMGRAAARATREILAYNHELRKELRELVRTLDGGGALDVSGIPDAFLRSRLALLLDNLVQLRRNSAGQYFKRRGAEATVLSFVAPILEESADQLAPYKQASLKFAEEVAAAEAAAQAAEAAAGAAAANGGAAEEEERAQRGASPAPVGPQVGPAGPPQQPQQQGQQEGLVESEGDGSDGEGAGAAAGPIGPIGPAAFPPERGASEQPEGDEEEEDGDVAAGARRAGPAMPPAEWLAAAAQMEYPIGDEEGAGAEEDEEEDFLVGPPPPEVAEELDAASMDERTAEVARVMRVLAAHAAELAKATAAEAAERPPDAYDVLGVEHDAPAAEVKKRYWRLSLLIHPDKCDHPKAHDAFQAVTGAAKELQDAALRKKVDERRQDAELRREFAAVAAREERERQWRIAKGQATAADLAGPVVAQPVGVQRETWMTELPPERSEPTAAAMPTGPFQGFSAKGVQSRGDTSGWTMTPQQRAAQLEGGSAAGAAGAPLLLTSAAGADGGVAAANPRAAARMAAAVDAYNASGRAKSLMELHQERLAAGGDKKKRKKEKGEKGGKDKGEKGGGKGDLGYDPAQHPWRPFDREKDLGPGLNAKAKAEDLLKGQRALGSKFSGGQGGGRTFL